MIPVSPSHKLPLLQALDLVGLLPLFAYVPKAMTYTGLIGVHVLVDGGRSVAYIHLTLPTKSRV